MVRMFGDVQVENSDKSTNQRCGEVLQGEQGCCARGSLHLSPAMCNRNGETAPCPYQASQNHGYSSCISFWAPCFR